MATETDVTDYRDAFEKWWRQKELMRFRVHRQVYLWAVCGAAFSNLMVFPKVPWFLFVALGWGIGVLAHYLITVRRRKRN